MLRWNRARSVSGSIFTIIFVLLAGTPLEAVSTTPKSTNYSLDETSVGNGGMLQASSTNYNAAEVSGDIGIGRAASSNYQLIAGSKTTPDPVLSVAVLSSNADFGILSSTTTKTATASFTVKNYTSYGYIVQLQGPPPKNQGHTINGMTVAGTSQTGIEQFGMNLVANTQPASIGANPDNGNFGFGAVASGYNTPNTYKYVSGDTVAMAAKESGVTNYTISYILNVAPLTPGGKYQTAQTLIVVGTY